MKTLIILFITVFFSSVSFGQINIGGKIKDKAQERLENKTDRTIDKGLDKTEEGVDGVFKKKDKDKDSDDGNSGSDDGDGSSDGNNTSKTSDEKPALMSYTKYDFVPGDQIILYEDFSQDAVGDFPTLWTTTGSGEVRTLNNFPGNWLYMNSSDNTYTLMKDMVLSSNFIFEFDVVPSAGDPKFNPSAVSFALCLYNGIGEFMNGEAYPGGGGFHIGVSNGGWLVKSYIENAVETMEGSSNLAPIQVEEMSHVIVWVQNRRIRIYHKGQKVIDLPTILYQGAKYTRLRFSLWGESSLPYITNIRFTTAAPDTRSKLLTEGKLISYGIYFDSGKDVVKAESYGALKDIAKVLTENPDVKIKVVGHTDADGDDASNLDLSKRRAANVKTALVKDFTIDAGRIETDGSGESQPISPNDNPENKAKNRRVEFLKL